MPAIEYGRIVVRNLVRRKRRTILTTLGIIIGVSIVVALASLGEGLRGAVLQEVGYLGADTVVLLPAPPGSLASFTGGPPFTDDQVRTIETTTGIRDAGRAVMYTVTIEYRGERKSQAINAIDSALIDIFETSQGYQVAEGRRFRAGASELVVGARMARKLFKDPIKLGQHLMVDGHDFEVVGIFAEVGTQDPDNYAYGDLKVIRTISKNEGHGAVVARLSPGARTEPVVAALTKRLKQKRGSEDFTILTPMKAQEAASSIIGVVELFLLGVAGIALLVGGIGIMNTMYTSVLERTREIGIFKAMGANDREIFLIFMLESGVLSLAGGVVGVVLGLGGAKLVELVAKASGSSLKVPLSPEIVLFGLAFSFFVGVISGVVPARQASKLNPVEALRS